MQFLTQDQMTALRERGLSDTKIAELAQKRGLSVPTGDTGMKGFATGVGKNLLRTALSSARIIKPVAQRYIAAKTPLTLDQTRQLTPELLDEETPQGQAANDLLEPKSASEKAGNAVANIATFFVPTTTGVKATGMALKGAGYAASKLGIGMSAKEAPLVQAYRARTPLLERMTAILKDDAAKSGPITNRETALRQGIFGTESMIGVQAKRGAERLWGDVVSPALKSAKETVNFRSFTDEIAGEIDQIDDLSRRRELQNALDAFKDDFKDVGDISLEQLQKYKEGWAKFLPDKVYRGQPIAGSFREVQNLAAHLARNKIYKAVGDEVRAAYFDYGNLKNLQELGQKAMTQSKLKGGAGSFVSGLMDMTLIPIATTGGLGLYKAGKGIEFVGAAGLKTVKEIFGLTP